VGVFMDVQSIINMASKLISGSRGLKRQRVGVLP
jgi:hypothetical protein